jgi:hypothetical protein
MSLPHLHSQAATQESRAIPIVIKRASGRLLFHTFRSATLKQAHFQDHRWKNDQCLDNLNVHIDLILRS